MTTTTDTTVNATTDDVVYLLGAGPTGRVDLIRQLHLAGRGPGCNAAITEAVTAGLIVLGTDGTFTRAAGIGWDETRSTVTRIPDPDLVVGTKVRITHDIHLVGCEAAVTTVRPHGDHGVSYYVTLPLTDPWDGLLKPREVGPWDARELDII